METTFWRFYSEMRVFISQLKNKPLEAKLGEYLEKRDLTKKKVINYLIDNNVIERDEKILDSTNSDKEKPTYTVKYKVFRDGFKNKLKKMYNKYFGEENGKVSLNEDEGGGALGGATSCGASTGEYTVPFLSPIRQRKPRFTRKKKKGKKRKKRKVVLSEAQFSIILEKINLK